MADNDVLRRLRLLGGLGNLLFAYLRMGVSLLEVFDTIPTMLGRFRLSFLDPTAMAWGVSSKAFGVACFGSLLFWVKTDSNMCFDSMAFEWHLEVSWESSWLPCVCLGSVLKGPMFQTYCKRQCETHFFKNELFKHDDSRLCGSFRAALDPKLGGTCRIELVLKLVQSFILSSVRICRSD